MTLWFYSKRIASTLLVIFALFAGQAAAQDESGDGGGGRSEGRGRGGFGRRGGGGGSERGGGERGSGGGGGGERGGGERGSGGGERGSGGGERGSGGGERGSGGGRGGFGGGGFNPAEMFDKLDTNKNGQIEPSERTGRTGAMVEGIAKRAGLDPSQPLSIQKLRETMSSFGRGGPDGGKSGESKDKPADAKAAEEKAAADKKAKQSSFPGFGTKLSTPAVPGFGEVATADKADKSKSGDSSRGRGGFAGRGGDGRGDRRGGDRGGDDDSPADDPPVSPENKTRTYAESLFKRYDTNKNGTLEKDEWSQMSGQPEKADKNGDGKVTLDELTDSLASYGKGDDGGSAGKGPAGGGGSSRSGSKGGKPNRFLTATERLPAGLPGWFTRNDADGDGQVMMSEYATTWTTAKVAEFTQYDLNGDGVITPQECLSVDKKGSDKKVADKPADKK